MLRAVRSGPRWLANSEAACRLEWRSRPPTCAIRLAALSVCLLIAPPAFALDPSHALWQYGHSVWRLQDGALPAVPFAIAQGSDGHLWVGTEAGPFRFDGRSFNPLADASGQPLLNEAVIALLSAHDGSLWMGSSLGAWRWHGGVLRHIESHARVNLFREDARGDVWYSRTRDRDGQPIGRFANDQTRLFGASTGLPAKYADGFVVDRDGSLWVGALDGLLHWDGHASQSYGVEGRSTTHNQVPPVVQMANDGSIWLGFSGFGLQHLVGGHLQPVELPDAGTTTHVEALLVDRADTVWVGTTDHGLYRVRGDQIEHFDVRDGLSSDSVFALFEDREGNLWVGTTAGLDRFRDLKVTSISSRDGIAANRVQSLAAAPDGSLWISDLVAIEQLRDGRVVRRMGVGDATTGGGEFTKVFVDRSDRVWVGVDDDLAVLENGRFKRIRSPNGEHVGVVVDIAQDAQGAIWAVTTPHPGRIVRVVDDQVVENLKPDYGVMRVLAASDGSVWASTNRLSLVRLRGGPSQEFSFGEPGGHSMALGLQSGAEGSVLASTDTGLVVSRAGKTRKLSMADGLPCQRLFGIVVDHSSAVWLDASCGLLRLSAEDLEGWWKLARPRVTPQIFDASDGAQPGPVSFGTLGAVTTDGRIWFANGETLQTVDPAHISHNAVIPQVHIESLTSDRQRFLPGPSAIELRTNPRTVQINYTATSFVAPEKVFFRYRLEGHDVAWQEAGPRREAFYTDLAPGHYRFHVMASNDDGLWNETGASVDLVVPPTFVQTPWFVAICALFAMLAVWLGYEFRLRQVRIPLEARAGERERIATELHDTLLQAAQGLVFVLDGRFRDVSMEAADRMALDRAVAHANDLVRDGRDRIYDLRTTPSSSAQLFRTLQTDGEALAAVGAAVKFHATWRGSDRSISGSIWKELRHLGAEALSNAFRHAHATTISLAMESGPRGLEISVRDDGVGITTEALRGDRSSRHWGIAGMRERAKRIGGRLSINAHEEGGTEVRVTVAPARAFGWRPWRPRWLSLRRDRAAAEG
jgi:ligand-binding sensor domain-containing protein/anti-sigma regulatory factor (Ser/Thr protein kinase)